MAHSDNVRLMIANITSELSALDGKLKSIKGSKPPLSPTDMRALEAAGLINFSNENAKAALICESMKKLAEYKSEDPTAFMLATDALKVTLSRDSRAVEHVAYKYSTIVDAAVILSGLIYIVLTHGGDIGSSGDRTAAIIIVIIYAGLQLLWKALASQYRERKGDRDYMVDVLNSQSK